MAKRIGDNFYNRNVRPTIKRPVIGEAEIENPGKKKGKMKKKGYCLSGEKWNIDTGASRKEKEEAKKQFKRFSDADSIQEKKEALMKAVVFIQKQFREMEPSQTVEDLSSFWEGGDTDQNRMKGEKRWGKDGSLVIAKKEKRHTRMRATTTKGQSDIPKKRGLNEDGEVGAERKKRNT